ncbi:hypothetical protein BU25DRAFT_440020 [Macroventuria anomochaeta]|uniref:Uncharacterized protein n=1 Tax=Macroventuria anomochaeta TaxID=301207 RepID=A0ACB6S3C2_9PLEO|nr:uncharacterized protein BU25DRAFT_440020 [Macroventuria anomochaeta]KAF2627637.1 hypothetical protein BU25DRAFT_440020 [Macroventuria anomochaeta]
MQVTVGGVLSIPWLIHLSRAICLFLRMMVHSHLTGFKIPSVSLSSTSGDQVDVSKLSGLAVIFCYPPVKSRVHLPYELLSDADLKFTKALKLSTFEWQGKKLIKRLALAVEDGQITKVWYPVFPPNANAKEVVAWLATKN